MYNPNLPDDEVLRANPDLRLASAKTVIDLKSIVETHAENLAVQQHIKKTDAVDQLLWQLTEFLIQCNVDFNNPFEDTVITHRQLSVRSACQYFGVQTKRSRKHRQTAS